MPKSITKQISTCENSEQYITNFLQNALPSTDTGSIANELRKVKRQNTLNYYIINQISYNEYFTVVDTG